ncbi:MAG TPA: hypothetical protein VN700_17330 [Vicinamibacterales bacterium]|nr:hypothetical protein [Vicinamibacterales bacterium]
MTDARLAQRGLAPAALLDALGSAAGDAHAVLVVGSVAEDFPDPDADLDLLIVDDEGSLGMKASALAVRSSVGVSRSLDLHHANLSRARACLEMVEGMDALFRDPSRLAEAQTIIKVFTTEDLWLMHTIKTGIPIHGAPRVDGWRKQMHGLANLLTVYCLGLHLNYREDALAQARFGDPLSAMWMLAPAADWLAASLLATQGETNPSAHRRPALLDRHRETFGADRMERLQSLLAPEPLSNVKVAVRRALLLFDVLILDIFERCPAIAGPIEELRRRSAFVTHFD